MKKSISYWAFEGGLEGTKDIRACFAEAKEFGFEAVELAIGAEGVLTPKTTKKECAQIRKWADEAGVEIASCCTGIYWGGTFSSSSAKVRNGAIAVTKKMLQVTGWLGADALLTIPASVDVFFDPEAEVVSYDDAYERAKKGIEKALPMAEKAGVAIAIENVWNKVFLSPLELRDFIDSFGSEFVGSYFDVGNCLLLGYPEQWIRILGRRIKRVHLKDFKRAVGTVDGFCDLLEGDVNWPAVMAALRAVKYDSYLTGEMIPLYANAPDVRLKNTSNAMDAIFAM